MTTTIDLTEYERWQGPIGDRALDDLADLAADRLVIGRSRHGVAEIKATAHVGVLMTTDLTVRVRPKVPLDNLFYLLGVGDERWRIDTTHTTYGDEHDDLANALIRLYAREVDHLTGRGLRHGYVSEEASLVAVRGRIDVSATYRRPWQRTPLPCRYDEFVPDIWINQALLAALTLAGKAPFLPTHVRADVHLLRRRFENVSTRPITGNDVDRWTPTRHDRHYRLPLTLAAAILHRLTLNDRGHGRTAATFTIDMNALFEQFIGRELAARLPTGLALTTQYPTHLDTGGRFPIRPDLVIHPTDRPHTPLHVADVKYKLTDDLGSVDDHYQLLAYATVLGLRGGTLIYCQAPDGSNGDPRSSLGVRASDREHVVHRLDLTGTRTDIVDRLDNLASQITIAARL